MLGDVAIDGGLQVDDGMEHAPLEATLRQFGEEALDGVEPGKRGRGEVDGEALMAVEPGTHLVVLMGGVIVEDDVDGLVDRHLGVNGVEKADELLVAMALHVATDDGAVEHIESSNKRGRAVALVVVGHGGEPPLVHGQGGLGAVERLDLAFLVDRKHDGIRRQVGVEADDVAQFVDEVRMGGELALPPAIRLQPVCLLDGTHRAEADFAACAIMSAVQCVVSPGGCRNVSDARPLPVRAAECARAASSRAQSLEASCQRHTQAFDLPVYRIISTVAQAVGAQQPRMYSCGALRSLISAVRRWRSVSETVNDIPVRLTEIPPGLLR